MKDLYYYSMKYIKVKQLQPKAIMFTLILIGILTNNA